MKLCRYRFWHEGIPAEVVMADTAYDADHLRRAIAAKGALAVSPATRHVCSNIRSTGSITARRPALPVHDAGIGSALLTQHDGDAHIVAHNVERVLAEIDADRAVAVLGV